MSLSTTNNVAGVEPKIIDVTFVKLVPVMVTLVDPVVGPEAGSMEVMVGTFRYVKVVVDEYPFALVTITLTGPADPEGETHVILVSLSIIKLLAGVEPKVTDVTFVKLVPVMVTEVEPVVGPEAGVIELMVGTFRYVNALGNVAVPPGLVTDTPTCPAVSSGETHVIVVLFTITTLVAGVEPKVTDVTFVKLVPVMVTEVDPVVGPEAGSMEVIVGLLTLL